MRNPLSINPPRPIPQLSPSQDLNQTPLPKPHAPPTCQCLLHRHLIRNPLPLEPHIIQPWTAGRHCTRVQAPTQPVHLVAFANTEAPTVRLIGDGANGLALTPLGAGTGLERAVELLRAGWAGNKRGRGGESSSRS